MPIKWYALAENLAQLLGGNATAAWLAYAGRPAFDMGDDSSDFIFNNDASSGSRYWTQDRKAFLDKILPIINTSMFGPGENIDYYTKQQWIVPKTDTFVPRASFQTAHPILLVSMTIDPICPLVSAKSTQKVFQDSSLVEIKGYGHCSVSVVSSCAAKHIRAFLYDGTMPPMRHTMCEIDGTYFVAPEQHNKIRARKPAADTEEENIQRAQSDLVKKWEWEVRRSGLPMPI